MPSRRKIQHASAGHKLGQLVGDWFEEYFVLPLLTEAAEKLKLYLDCRFQQRTAHSEKIIWRDADGNGVDFDFVLELGGSHESLGIPVAFFESFWRRGARHSKDKARDDSGKLLPMSDAYPTARFLGIVAAGDFTQPARQFVLSRGIDLFYAPKKIVDSFAKHGLVMDYPDRASEREKGSIARNFEHAFDQKQRQAVAAELCSSLGQATIQTYVDRVGQSLGALPQELRFLARQNSAAQVFETIEDASHFLESPTFDFSDPIEEYLYEITFSDGSEFRREATSLEHLKQLHRQIDALAAHMSSLT